MFLSNSFCTSLTFLILVGSIHRNSVIPIRGFLVSIILWKNNLPSIYHRLKISCPLTPKSRILNTYSNSFRTLRLILSEYGMLSRSISTGLSV